MVFPSDLLTIPAGCFISTGVTKGILLELDLFLQITHLKRIGSNINKDQKIAEGKGSNPSTILSNKTRGLKLRHSKT